MANHYHDYHVGDCVTTSKDDKIVPEKIKISRINVVKKAFCFVFKNLFLYWWEEAPE